MNFKNTLSPPTAAAPETPHPAIRSRDLWSVLSLLSAVSVRRVLCVFCGEDIAGTLAKHELAALAELRELSQQTKVIIK